VGSKRVDQRRELDPPGIRSAVRSGWLSRILFSANLLVLLGLGACSPTVMAGGPSPETEGQKFARLESRYSDARELAQQARVTESRGAEQSLRGNSLAQLQRSATVARANLLESLKMLDTTRLDEVDRRAWRTMEQTLRQAPGAVASTSPAGEPADTSCQYDARRVALAPAAREILSRRIYRCYGKTARTIVYRGDTLDRLTILDRLGTTGDSVERRHLWRALVPMWMSVNAENAPTSPFRTLMTLSAEEWKRRGSYPAIQVANLGMDPSTLEPLLVRILGAWRDNVASTPIEPWDWYYVAGAASRRLSPLISHDALREISDKVYRELGANPTTLGIHYDLEPRAGKTPVAFTDFGTPPRFPLGGRGQEGTRAESWVFATYRVGGLDNLNELLHETGHAVHIAAIDTRPAFADWPDSDIFTEGVAELVALEAYEPVWQRRYLGDSVRTEAAMHARYAGVVMDVAWALFELRMHADPTRDPNTVWTTITNEYLHIVPHPEYSWWAARGQLVDLPGYMVNYAMGAVVAADIRARVTRERGGFSHPNAGMYRWLSEHLYRWGLQRSTKEVLREFLGRPLSEAALLEDMKRLRPAAS